MTLSTKLEVYDILHCHYERLNVDGGNTHRKSCEFRACGFQNMRADGQTYRHTDCSILHPYWRQSNEHTNL